MCASPRRPPAASCSAAAAKCIARGCGLPRRTLSRPSDADRGWVTRARTYKRSRIASNSSRAAWHLSCDTGVTGESWRGRFHIGRGPKTFETLLPSEGELKRCGVRGMMVGAVEGR